MKVNKYNKSNYVNYLWYEIFTNTFTFLIVFFLIVFDASLIETILEIIYDFVRHWFVQ